MAVLVTVVKSGPGEAASLCQRLLRGRAAAAPGAIAEGLDAKIVFALRVG